MPRAKHKPAPMTEPLATVDLEMPEPEPMPASGPEPSAEFAAGSAADDGAHVADIPVPDEGGAPIDAATGQPALVMPFDEWNRCFCLAFNVSGSVLQLRTLQAVTAATPYEVDAARAVYDTACEVDALRFLVEPQGKWMQRAAAVGLFGYSLAGAVQHEVAAKRQAKARGPAPAGGPEPAPEPRRDVPAEGTVRHVGPGVPRTDSTA